MLPYNQSLALLTDFYQMTMAYGFWKAGMQEKEAVFHLFFRKNPFGGGFTVMCGLEYLLDFVERFHFDESDTSYLQTLQGSDGRPIFEGEFLKYLQGMRFELELDAIPEGTMVFPLEPLVRVRGPIIQCQILETALLNIVNFQSLIATKAARIFLAARGDPIIEFGLRRAQGMDGGLAASRAAYIGGCSATSNVLAGKIFGIPVRGTHAHSWVMAFDDEIESFREYSKIMPGNCVFLVDTYDSIAGVRKAIEVGMQLRQRGYDLLGIRLDSGDLAYLSIEARKLLDQAGFSQAKIVASNDLDETIIQSLKEQGARIDVWGVGTKLITAYDQPALGGVYKLSAIRDKGGPWKHRIKLSEQAIKISNPGIQQVRRFSSEKESLADMIYDVETNMDGGSTMIDPMDITRQKHMGQELPFVDLLVPLFRKGRRVYETPPLPQIRENTLRNLDLFHFGIKRLVHPHQYPVGVEKSLFDLKTKLVMQARKFQ